MEGRETKATVGAAPAKDRTVPGSWVCREDGVVGASCSWCQWIRPVPGPNGGTRAMTLHCVCYAFLSLVLGQKEQAFLLGCSCLAYACSGSGLSISPVSGLGAYGR